MNQTTNTHANDGNGIGATGSMVRMNREQTFTLKAFMVISSMITALWVLTG